MSIPVTSSVSEDAHGKIKRRKKRRKKEAIQISQRKEESEAGKEERKIGKFDRFRVA
jgi:hypothetical protein